MARPAPKKLSANGCDFTIVALPPTQGWKLFRRLMKAAGPALEALGGAVGGAASLAHMDVGAFGKAIGSFADGMTDDEFDFVTKKLLEPCLAVKEGKAFNVAQNIDMLFDGDLLGLFTVLAHCLEVNYRDFLAGALSKIGAQAPNLPALSAELANQPNLN